MAIKEFRLNITGMMGDHCEETVLTALGTVDGVKFAQVSIKDNIACVEYEDTVAKPEDFVEAVDTAGYGASLI